MVSVRLAGLLVLLTLVSGVAAQEPYPTRSITIVAPYPPGGAADLTARPFAPALERVLKQPVLILNKPGAGGAVGTQSVAVAKPDGYTIMLTVFSISTIPEADRMADRTPTFTRDQFVPIARLNADPTLLMVRADAPWKTVKELVEDAKKRPDAILYASAGPYTVAHMAMEVFMQAAGIRLRHLPTTGGGPDAQGARLRRRGLPVDRTLRAEGRAAPRAEDPPGRCAAGGAGRRVQGGLREDADAARVPGR
jgi:tripartite-type tricarboxylate transporter receptor subunit TctC